MRRGEAFRITVVAALAGLIVGGSLASASPIGQEVAGQVSEAGYQQYLDDELYTHNGDDRHWGPEHDLARDNIVAVFEGLGLDVELHPFLYDGTTYHNVVATQTGTVYPDAQYIVGGHFDSYGSPGADDNASGVAGTMELARVLSQYETEYTIKYIAFDREEQWMVGSQAYVDDHLIDDIRGMINLDMIAYDGSGYEANISGRTVSLALRSAMVDAVAEYGPSLTVVLAGDDPSDQEPFELAGFAAVKLSEDDAAGIWGGSNPCYHSACDSVDTVDYIDYAYATVLTRVVAGFLADYASVVSQADCDNDGVPDVEQIQADPLLDYDDNGVLDECEIDPPAIAPEGSRYVSIAPQPPDLAVPVALRVVGDAENPDVSCVDAYLQDDGTLGPVGYFLTPAAWGTVSLWGEEVIPETTYSVQAELPTGLLTGATAATTWKYGDVDHDGLINISDILLIIGGFQGDFTEASLASMDQTPCVPDGAINVGDILAAISGFQGQTYLDSNCTMPCP